MHTNVQSIGIILDGNRRWAVEKELPIFEGHRNGANNIEPIVFAARDLGIQHVAIYAFSTENWNRDSVEVAHLMELFESFFKEGMDRLMQEGVRIRFIGQRKRFNENLQRLMREVEAKSPTHPQTTLWVCVSYGGRADIVQAAQVLAHTGDTITEDSLTEKLWSAGIPDLDLIIRTGGERRISNFLLWQSAYSELFFVSKHWPDFTKDDLLLVLEEYSKRTRRLGK